MVQWVLLVLSLVKSYTLVPLDRSMPRTAVSEDSVRTHAMLAHAVSEFHVTWQLAWQASERARAASPQMSGHVERRLPYLHCHPDVREARELAQAAVRTVNRNLRAVFRPDTQYMLIGSEGSKYAVCPSWLLSPSIPRATDESVWRDGALTESHRETVQAARTALLATLGRGAAAYPGSDWIIGQQVRFALDQRDTSGARQLTSGCRAAAWWCAGLSGYVSAAAGRVEQADTTFARMRRLMSAAQRCDWTDVGVLLRGTDRRRVDSLSCGARRDSLLEQFWWLADPLFRDAGNARQVEQDVRRMMVALHQATGQDERYAWDAARGGRALAELVQRYGWPTYTAWGGERVDTWHTSDYLELYLSPPAWPYTTFEYSPGRVSTLPKWEAVLAPFASSDSMWVLAQTDSSGAPIVEWWPHEHFRAARRLGRFEDVQVALLRRQRHAAVAMATQLTHPLLGLGAQESADVLLLSSRGPGHVDSLAHAVVPTGGKAVLQGMLAPGSTVLSMEARGGGDVRARVGVTTPPLLSDMRAAEIGISDPILLHADGRAAAAALAAATSEEVLEQMRGSTRLTGQERQVGLYWETYGVAAEDTVKVSVRVARIEDIGKLRRLGQALNLAPDPSRGIAAQWTEPDFTRGTRTLRGPVPVQMRTVVLNLGTLAPGRYVVEVSAETVDGRTARGQRRIEVLP